MLLQTALDGTFVAQVGAVAIGKSATSTDGWPPEAGLSRVVPSPWHRLGHAEHCAL